MAKLISKTYGEALFELAKEENRMDDFLEEAKAVHLILCENTEFGKLMSHPRIDCEEKVKVVEEVFKGRLSEEMVGFLVLVIKKDRAQQLEAILMYFIDRVKAAKEIGVAFVTTAIELDEAARTRITQRLLDTTSYKEMEMHYQVEPSIIGGMIIRIGDRVIDSSITTKLNELKKQLMKIQLG